MPTQRSVWAYHWPGFESGHPHREREILQALRDAAFRIQHKPIPAMPVPDAPEMLPVGGVPLLSWRGSAGASGYDIQRAPAPGGPWQTIAENVSDASVAYRPLFSDTKVKVGDSVCYRVSARNASGQSLPSNVAGPIRVRGLCFVDELADLSQAYAKSSGLSLDNEYNSIYAEYLYRARGVPGEWIVYRVPGPVQSFRVAAWLTNMVEDLGFAVSEDGQAFTPVSVERHEQQFAPVPLGPAAGKRSTLVDYTSSTAITNGASHFKIQWHGPAALDRVEIYYR